MLTKCLSVKLVCYQVVTGIWSQLKVVNKYTKMGFSMHIIEIQRAELMPHVNKENVGCREASWNFVNIAIEASSLLQLRIHLVWHSHACQTQLHKHELSYTRYDRSTKCVCFVSNQNQVAFKCYRPFLLACKNKQFCCKHYMVTYT